MATRPIGGDCYLPMHAVPSLVGIEGCTGCEGCEEGGTEGGGATWYEPRLSREYRVGMREFHELVSTCIQ